MKVGIIGSGFVGATTAYAILMSRTASEIVLVDVNPERASAEAADILHAVPFVQPMNIRAGGYDQLGGADVLIITAGAAQKPGETRLDLLKANAAAMRQMVRISLSHAPGAILLVATNPVDIMTHLAASQAAELGLNPARVMGSGTLLDTARFKSLLAARLEVDPQHIHGYVIGEHGDSEVLAWSGVSVAGLSLEQFCRARGLKFESADQASIDKNVRQAAYQIIAGKKATYYGIGAALAHLVGVIAGNRHAILTVSTPLKTVADVSDVSLSLPNLIGSAGVIQQLPMTLSPAEQAGLAASALIIRQAIEELC